MVIRNVVSYRNSTSNHNSGTTTPNSALVVSYRNSTSNHNGSVDVLPGRPVVSYRNSTSNHNTLSTLVTVCPVVSYRNSTSNHNKTGDAFFRILVVSYRNSTSNHNTGVTSISAFLLYLIEILHQTTTRSAVADGPLRCILSKFYIKPQHDRPAEYSSCCCILSKFYIKPQLMVPSGSRAAVVSYRNSTSNHNASHPII